MSAEATPEATQAQAAAQTAAEFLNAAAAALRGRIQDLAREVVAEVMSDLLHTGGGDAVAGARRIHGDFEEARRENAAMLKQIKTLNQNLVAVRELLEECADLSADVGVLVNAVRVYASTRSPGDYSWPDFFDCWVAGMRHAEGESEEGEEAEEGEEEETGEFDASHFPPPE
jgi:hypothetical protein